MLLFSDNHTLILPCHVSSIISAFLLHLIDDLWHSQLINNHSNWCLPCLCSSKASLPLHLRFCYVPSWFQLGSWVETDDSSLNLLYWYWAGESKKDFCANECFLIASSFWIPTMLFSCCACWLSNNSLTYF